MNAKDAIKRVIEFSDMVTRSYVADLNDEDLLVRSVPGTNHIAWQLGHILTSEHQMLQQLGQEPPALPEDLDAKHSSESATSDNPDKFLKKQEYLSLLDTSKAAALRAVEATPETDLEKPGPEAMREYAPTVAAVLMLLGTHRLMHAGQFVPIRRKLGKKPLF
jgi:uncharacterized damage-inducible protein DinB